MVSWVFYDELCVPEPTLIVFHKIFFRKFVTKGHEFVEKYCIYIIKWQRFFLQYCKRRTVHCTVYKKVLFAKRLNNVNAPDCMLVSEH